MILMLQDSSGLNVIALCNWKFRAYNHYFLLRVSSEYFCACYNSAAVNHWLCEARLGTVRNSLLTVK